MSGSTHQSGDHDSVEYCRRGDGRACRELVEHCQPEILRTAYLFTGNANQTIDLTLSAFESSIARLAEVENGNEFRLELLASLAERYLTEQPIADQPEQIAAPISAMTGRFQVDNQRSRTLQTLHRLDPTERSVLVLYCFNGLPVNVIGQSSGLLAESDRILISAVERFRLTIDLPEPEPLRIALAEASIDAPRSDLWENLEEVFLRLQQRERQRSRLIVGVAIAFAAFVLFGGLALLIELGSSDRDATSSVAVTTATSLPERSNPTAGQTVLTPVPDRVANVPSAMLVSDGANLTIYQPENGDRIWTSETSGPVALSPDGSQIYSALEVRDERSLRVSITGAPTSQVGPSWETEILKLEGLTHPQALAFTVDIAASDTSVYIAYRTWQVPGPTMIVTLDRRTGAIIQEQPHNFTGPITGQIRLYVTPDDTELYLFIVAQWQDFVGRIDFIRFSLPQLVVKQHSQPNADNSDPSFLFWVSNMLPDSAGLYRVTYTGDSKSVIVRLFNFETASIRELALPFRIRNDESTLPFEATTSHDGQWLYVLAPSTGEMAIVDLETRQLDRMIPLKLGAFTPEFPGPVNGSTPLRPDGQHLQISNDGLRLYATGISYDRTFAVTDGVWVIDTNTWQVVDHWFQDRPVSSLVLVGNTLYVQSEVVQSQNPLTAVNPLPVSAIDVLSGDLITPIQPPLIWNIRIGSIADLYRQQYGISPHVDQNQPTDNRSFSSLARLEIVIDPVDVADGAQISIDLRFVDPTTNRPIEQDDLQVRFSPPDSITLALSTDTGKDVLVLPGQVSFGHYRAVVQLSSVGNWDLEVLIQGGITTDGPVRLLEAVTVLPSLTALEECAPIISGTDTSRTPTRGECDFQ